MKPIYKVAICIKEIQQAGVCTRGHKVGESYVFDGDQFFPELCPDALYVLYPWLQVFRYGGYNPWAEDEKGSKKIELCCPDPKNPIVFEVSRMEG